MSNEYEHKLISNLPKTHIPQDLAKDTVAHVINHTKQYFGERQNLFQLTKTRTDLDDKLKICIHSVTPKNPVGSAMKLIKHSIEQEWKLTQILKYSIGYSGSSTDECNKYHYFEAVFSQPTLRTPVPQVKASVFFTVILKQIEPADDEIVPSMYFRVEGHFVDHDMRFVTLKVDWILALMKMKLNFTKRAEALALF